MELTCLNCTGTFEAGDTEVAAAGGVLRCPLCGREQRFAARGNRPVPEAEPADESVRREAVSDSFGGAFRKPMQAFGGRRTGRPAGGGTPGNASPAGEPVRIDTTEMPPVDVVLPPHRQAAMGPRTPVPPAAPLPPPPVTVRSIEAAVAPEPVDAGSGVWIVKSPTGLVLEFPASNLLVNWSAVVENPAPYQVSRGGDSWMSLDEFLRETKRGIRATQAFRRGPEGRAPAILGGAAESGSGPASAEPSTTAASNPPADAAAGPPRASDTSPGGQRSAVSTTAQFTFKIANSSKPGFPRWAVALIIGGSLALLGGGAVVAFLFLK